MTNAATVIKKLPFPWPVGGQVANEVEVRPAVLGDLLEAEKEAHPYSQPNGFSVALACLQIVRAGTFTGPFTKGQFIGIKPETWFVIRDALQEADALGEGEQPSQAQPS